MPEKPTGFWRWRKSRPIIKRKTNLNLPFILPSMRFLLPLCCLLFLSTWAYGQSPGLIEYMDGQKTTYVGDGTGKCLGLKFTVRYPSAWRAAEGNRPHIVQKFVNGNGAMAMVIIKDMRGVATKAEMDRYYATTADLSEAVPGTFLGAKRGISIDGEKAYAMEYSQRQTAATGMSIYQHGIQYVLFYDHYMFTVMCANGSAGDSQEEVDALFERNRLFYGLIASSVVLTTKWNKY